MQAKLEAQDILLMATKVRFVLGGFWRKTFRTSVENETEADWETKEAALGHVVGSQVEPAYHRSDRLTKRALLLDQWAKFLKPSR